jgi:hypothetical protein
MILAKLGILVFFGKGCYSAFLFANLINSLTQSLKLKLLEGLK